MDAIERKVNEQLKGKKSMEIVDPKTGKKTVVKLKKEKKPKKKKGSVVEDESESSESE